ncbi:hypothetical protein H1Q63_35460 [Desmonostoc muscorum CCALA 125]|nr:hypothetical protein [Desmonostoc muscorum CCALA 125]
MDIGKGDSVKELICVLPNISMQMPSVRMQNDFISTAGNAFLNETQKDIENKAKCESV